MFSINKSNAWISKGLALHRLGKYDEAIKSFNKAIRINPENGRAWISKGGVLDNLGKYDEAIKCCDEAIR
ncbi:MAG: tetratricopeptide repeat protein, partial [Candidatus Humimicrobiaceae bacterium]